MHCSESSLLSTSTRRSFTCDATLISLEQILKISFLCSCFLLSMIMARNFPWLIISWINYWMLFLKQARVFSYVKLCAVDKKMKKNKSLKSKLCKWGLVLIPGKQLKLYLQGNFGYHLFWHIASCFSNTSRCTLQCLYWNHKL